MLDSSKISRKPAKIVYFGLIGSVIWLIVGILIGLSALSSISGYEANTTLASDIIFHPDIMIFGVLGGLLITERLEHMENFRVMNIFRISRPTIFSLYTGVLLITAGYIYSNSFATDLGLIMVIISSLLFLYYLTSKNVHAIASVRWIFGASVFSIALSAISSFTSPIWMNVQLTYLALLFPIIYILAERVELGFIRGMSERMISFQAILSWLIVLLSFMAVQFTYYPIKTITMGMSILLLITIVVIAIWFDPSFHSAIRNGKFQNYLRSGVMIAYIWLFIGLILFLIQMTTSQDILDAATHSIALGFIGTFIIAHSPIIFPMTLKKNATQDNVTYLPLIILTSANVMRVTGDLVPNNSSAGGALSYLSGYVLIFAIAAFIYNIWRITRN